MNLFVEFVWNKDEIKTAVNDTRWRQKLDLESSGKARSFNAESLRNFNDIFYHNSYVNLEKRQNAEQNTCNLFVERLSHFPAAE